MIFLALFEYAILASTFTIAKIAVGYADPLFIIGVRMIVSAPCMFLIHKLQKNNSFSISHHDIKYFILVGIFHIFVPFVGEFWALQYMSSAKTAITYSLTPFIAAILSYLLLKKKISSKQSLGLIIGLLGLLPLLVSGDEHAFSKELFFISVPEITLLIAVGSASYAWFLVSDLMNKGYGISLINGIAMLIGGFLSLGLWALSANSHSPLRGDLSDFILWTSLLILVANIISYNFYGWLLKHISITLMSVIGFSCPIFASLYGLLLLNEQLGLTHLMALLMVGAGIWLFYREEVQKTWKIPKPLNNLSNK
jgi:drug/metabolite transporter (DMT)-like permease